jgi:TolB-like protein
LQRPKIVNFYTDLMAKVILLIICLVGINQRFKISLIGPFGLFGPGGERVDVTSKKSIALVALLAASPNGVRSRTWLQTMLWGTRNTAQAQASLRREVSNLAKLLAAHGAGHLLIRETQRIALALDHVDIDLLGLGLQLPSPSLRFRGEFLEGLDLRDCDEFEDWMRNERERVEDMLNLEIPEHKEPQQTALQIVGSGFDAHDMLDNRPPMLPPKPSVAVIPFHDLSSSAGGGEIQDPWLGAAMADEVAMLLSQYPQLFIVSSAGTRALMDAGLSKPEIARQLGVQYVLEGNIRASGNAVRVGVSLLDGATAEQIWGHGFNGGMGDVHLLQQQIAAQIAPQIWTKIDSAERSRSIRHRPISTDNYVLYWRANALFRSWSHDDLEEAIALTRQALANDPTCPWNASLLGFCHGLTYLLGFATNRAAARHEAITHYQSALRFGEDNAEIIGYAVGTLVAIGGDMAVADRLVAHALNLLPAHQPTLFWGGWVDLVAGNPVRARERFELALRLNPATGVRSPTLTGIGFAALLEGNIKDAHLFLTDAIKSTPIFFIAPVGLCVTATLVGDQDTALTCAQMLQSVDHSQLLGMIQNTEQRALLQGAIDRNMAQLQLVSPAG